MVVIIASEIARSFCLFFTEVHAVQRALIYFDDSIEKNREIKTVKNRVSF